MYWYMYFNEHINEHLINRMKEYTKMGYCEVLLVYNYIQRVSIIYKNQLIKTWIIISMIKINKHIKH